MSRRLAALSQPDTPTSDQRIRQERSNGSPQRPPMATTQSTVGHYQRFEKLPLEDRE
jgi:hypothetical protein